MTNNNPVSGNRKTLYVLFHGLWGFEATPDKILAHTPIEEDHDFLAGYYLFEEGQVVDQTEQLIPGVCRLSGTGTQAQTTNIFEPELNVILKDVPFEGAAKRFCVVELPLPRKILSLRNVHVPKTPRHPFAGLNGEDLHPKQVSMVQVFVYEVENMQDVVLTPPGVRPKEDPSTNTAKIHVYAQPKETMMGTMAELHGRDAYTKLAYLFGLRIIPAAPLFEAASDPKTPGLDSADMLNLSEQMKMNMGILHGESGSNCDALVIDNTGLQQNRSQP